MISKIFWSFLLAAPASIGVLLAMTPAIAGDSQSLSESNSAVVAAQTVETADSTPIQLPIEDTQQIAQVADLAPISETATAVETVPAVETAPLASDDQAQLQAYELEGEGEVTEDQVTSVSQLSDVQPTDWAFQALQNLVERYGCIAGYPDGTYRGQRALTRYEFAAGMNACLDRITELIQASGNVVTREDLATIQRLQEEYAAELATIRGMVDNLEARTAELEANQFSTTTKLVGETVFAVSDIFGGEDIDIDDPGDDGFGSDLDEENNTVFQSRVRLNFDTSFSGTDRLRARLQFGNFQRFNDDPSNGETRLGFETTTGDNTIQLDDLNYEFNVGEQLRFNIFANGADLRDLVFGNAISPFISSGRGAISRFGRFNPIYRIANSSIGAAFRYRFTNPALTRNILNLEVAYGGGEGNNPSEGNGLFNGDYGLLAQLSGRSFLGGNLDFALTYVNAYADASTALNWGVGSRNARVSVGRPVVSNSYGLELNYRLSSSFQIGGWAGYSFVRALEVGDAEVLNYAVTLAFPDLGGAGNLGGIVFGMQPRLEDADSEVFGGIDSDPDTGFHTEVFYRFALTPEIDLTPGVIWLSAPNHDEDNNDIFIGTLRTTFRF